MDPAVSYDQIDATVLQARLDAVAAQRKRAASAIGLCVDGRLSLASVGCDGPAMLERRPVPVGCVAKLLTAMLLEDAVAAGRLAYEAELGDVLPAAQPGPCTARITLRHLVEHRHGLDGPAVAAAPVRGDGRIDAKALLATLDRRLFRAGALYSYSDAGPWLIAAALEHVSGHRYAALLRALLARYGPGDAERCDDGRPVCPSRGGALALSLTTLLALARRRVRSPPPPAGAMTRLPGWHPLEIGIELGWKHYSNGWIGHQSTYPDASLWLRVHRAQRTALVVATRGQPATLVALRAFSGIAPALTPNAPPASVDRLLRHDIAGRYASQSRHIDIHRDSLGALRLRSLGREAHLRAGQGSIYFVEPALDGLASVEHIETDGAAPYLWTGRDVLPRIAAQGAAVPPEAHAEARSAATHTAKSMLELVSTVGC